MQCDTLQQVRGEIIRLIGERSSQVEQAAGFQKDEDGVQDNARVEAVMAKVRRLAGEYGACPGLAEAPYRKTIGRFTAMEPAHFRLDTAEP